MMNRYLSSFLITALLYTSMVAGIFYVNEISPLTKASKEISKEPSKVRVALLAPPVKAAEKKVEKPKKIEKKPEKKIVKKEIKKPKKAPKKELKKIVKKDPPKKIKPLKKEEPKPKETVKKEPVKKIEPKKEESVKKVVNSAPKKAAPKVAKKTNKEIESKNIKKLQDRYFAALQKKINENKSYPKRARIRNIQGDIKVEFEISPKGELLSFRIVEGKKLFFRSTKKAIEESFPLSPPMGVLSRNTTVKLTLSYRLF